MNRAVASLIVRMQVALIEEGIGPRPEDAGDAALVGEALAVYLPGADVYEVGTLKHVGLVDDTGAPSPW